VDWWQSSLWGHDLPEQYHGGNFYDPIVGSAVLTAGGDGTSTVFSGLLRDGVGSLGLEKIGGGTFTLTGMNTYTGGTTVTAGTLQIGNAAASGSIVGDVVDNAAVVFNRSDTVTFAGAVSGTGNLSQTGSGTLVLTGTSSYTGPTLVSSGVLQVDGVLGNTAVTVQSGTELSGHGTIGGSVTIQHFGRLAPGLGAQTLNVSSLFLNPVAILGYQLGTPGVIGSGTNTLVNVAGNLTLDGLLNVTDGGGFGSGAYRLLNYGGTLTNLALSLGTLPVGFSAANVTVTTAVAGQVNLVVNAAGAPTQFWDGSTTDFNPSLNGGSGTWNNFTTNFTNGTAAPNQVWQNGVAVFAANPGTVTLGADILFQGMQFESDGYSIVAVGDFALHPTGTAIITTDPGVSADISAPIVGAGGLNKTGLGLLSLSGVNSYSGGTTVSGGVLSVAADTNLGDLSGGVILAGGEIETSAAFTNARSVFLASGNGPNILAAAASTTGIYIGLISCDGGLTLGDGTNPGRVEVTNVNNSYTGGTTISGATLRVVNDANLGDVSGGLNLDGGELSVADEFSSARAVALTANGGTLAVSAAGGAVFSGNITGAGGLTIGNAVDTGVIGLSGTNTYLGSTTIASGATLQALSTTAFSSVSAFIVEGTLDVNGFSNEVGSLAGEGTVTNGNTTPAVLTAGGDNSNTGFSGVLEDGTNPLGLTKVGIGTLELSGTSTYSDATTISTGTVQAGSTTAFSPNSAFTVNGDLDLVGFSNTIGSLAGTGTVTSGGLPSSAITPLGNPVVAPAVLTTGGDETSTVFSGVLRNGVGSLGLEKVGRGTLTLTGTNTYTGGTIVTAGTLQVGNAAASGSIVGDVVNNAALVFNRTDTVTFAGAVSGTGNLNQAGSGGTLVLTGTSTYTGTTVVSAGTLQVDGVLANTAVTVEAGTTLSGQGTIGGSVTVLDTGHLAPGPGAQTLSVESLALSSGSILDYQLSTPGVIDSGVNSLVSVAGNLTLAGVLNVTDGGNFGSGSYRLINYGGTLTDLSLALGTLPVGFSGSNVTVTTAVAGQVNLVVSAAGAPAQFWDGSNTVFDSTVHGGNGTWNNFATNFTNGTAAPNQAWQNGVAVFSAAPGSVTLGADILFQGMQFTIDGYVVDATGAFALHPTGTAIITTDTGVGAGISAPIVGTGGLNKAGLGLLTLAGENTYTGGTIVSGGVLIVSADFSLGDPSGWITLEGGELETTTIFTSARTIAIVSESAPNILAEASSNTATYTGVISGTGGLTVGDGTDLGTVALSNVNNSYFGGTTVSEATLTVSDDRNLGAVSGGITLDGGELVVSDGFSSLRLVVLTAKGGTLAAVAGASTDFQGDITGSGGLTIGDGVHTGIVGLAGTNTYLGSTMILSGATLKAFSTTALSPSSAFIVTGTLDVDGQSNTIGSLGGSGTVTNGDSINALLTVGSNNLSTNFSGVLEDGTHSLGLIKVGTGTLALSGVNTYSGPTTVSAGTLQAGSITALSSNSAFTVNATLNLHGFSKEVGSLAGTGTLTDGPGISNGISPLENLMVGPAVLTAGGNNGSTVFSGVLMDGSGSLGLAKAGTGALILTGANTYTDGTTITAGILQLGNGAAMGSIVGDVVDNGSLVFSRSDTVTFAGAVSGTGNLSQAGPETLILTGTSSYTGTTTVVSGGTLQVDGVLGNTAVTVQNGAILSGQGTIAGDVAISNGGHLAPGPGAETLGVGNLVLNSGATLDYQLSTPGVIGSRVNSLVNVTGNLTLGGVLNVTDGGMFGSGFYRLLNYAGALTNNVLTLGTLPMGFSSANVAVTTAVAGQVNLVVNTTGAPTQFWDGSNTVNDLTVHGGNGTWVNFVSTNFTNVVGTVNEAWQNGIAIFTANWGTVTLGSDILYQGMTFVSSDYAVVGDLSGSFALHPTGLATITTDSGVTATIAAPIVGFGGLKQAGPGLLVLMGANTYSGGTTVSGGTLSVASDTNLGDLNGGLTLAGGELLTTADGFITARIVDIRPGESNDILVAATGTTATYMGILSDVGALVVGDGTHLGTVVLTAANTYTGGTTINSGTLQIGDRVTSGSILGDVIDNGNLAFSRSDAVTFPGNI
jgi:fibronectin-binding autotransporter adhesin